MWEVTRGGVTHGNGTGSYTDCLARTFTGGGNLFGLLNALHSDSGYFPRIEMRKVRKEKQMIIVLLSILGTYVIGVVVVAAVLQTSEIACDKYSDGELAIISYLWPILAVLVVLSLPYEIGKKIGGLRGK